MKALVFAVLFLSLKAHALYVTEVTPSGQEVSPNIQQIRIKFSKDIVPLGTKEFKEEHSSKIVVTKGLDCGLSYSGLNAIVCRMKKPLLPGTDYKISIRPGFTGVEKEERLAYQHDHSFRSSSLAIIKYDVSWSGKTPVINLSLNYRVKEKDRSGTIQCPDRNIGVIFEPMKDKNGEAEFRVKSAEPLKDQESCVFYFNQPLVYRDSPGSFVPEQKVLLDPSISGVSANEGNFSNKATCSGNYNLSVDLFSGSLPYLRCEFNDTVDINLYLKSQMSIDITKVVTVIPNDGVKVSYSEYGIKLSNFRYPNKTYVVKIAKGIPTTDPLQSKSPIIFQVETINNPPLLAAAKAVGVIEREGPWQVAYSALNVKSAELIYELINKSSELGNLTEVFAPAQMLTEKKIIQINGKENENILYPLEVKELVKDKKFKAGLFTGKMSVLDVDPKYIQAEALIFKDQYSIDSRRQFQFSYLFTNIGLHIKKGRSGLLAWAFNLKEGTPIEGVEIKVYVNGAGEEVMTTDKDGLAFFKDFKAGRETKLVVVATKDDDISFINNNYGWNAGISRYDFNFGGAYWQEPQDLIVDVVAERPLYLPDEEVNLKLFVRKFIPDSMKLMDAGRSFKVSIFDSRSEEAYVTNIELNDYGTGTLKYKLPAKAPTGRYAVYLQEGTSTITLDSVFQVEEFRKPDFKVTIEDSGDSAKGKISYFKGGPVKNVSGEVAVMFRKTSMKLKDQDLGRFRFPVSVKDPYEWYYSNNELKILSRTEVESDENGEFIVEKQNTLGSISEYGNLILEGNFKDENGGNISGRLETLHNPFDIVPGIDLTKWMFNTGETISPEVVAIDKKGHQVSGVKMKLTLKLITHIYERRLGSGNFFYYDSRREEKEIGTCEFKTKEDFKACGIKVKETGYYEFTVKVDEARYKSDAATISTYVYEKGSYLGFEAANHDRINLNVDKSKVKLGDKLKVMAISPLQNAHALITFERDGILFKEQVKFDGNVLLYEKDITDEKLIPGFYVSVVIIKGRTSDKIDGQIDLGKPSFKIGYKRVDVENTEKRLGLKVTPVKKQVEPGQMMDAEITVKDHKGRGVKSELAIAVIDDALLSVSGPYKANYDILDTFYSLGTLGVDNYQTLTQLIGRRTFGKKGANAGGGGGFDIRSDFKNTAYWIAQVETDEKGAHKFQFKVPDNLTTWKIIAVAVDKNHRFGFGEDEFIASKALMIESNLPNFLVEGDKLDAKVTVTNRSGGSENLKITASSSALKLNTTEQKLTLAHDQKNSTFFPLIAQHPGKADLTVKASGKKLSDGFKTTFPVLSSSIRHAFGVNGLVSEKGVTIPLTFSSEAKPESLSLTLQYSSTAINGLDEVFRYVLHYPYGCWEQQLTASYFLVQYEEFKDLLTYRFPETEGSPKAAVQKILDKAAEYQTESGGMRYYPGGNESADVYLSVFTGYAFVTMKKVGYKIDPKVESNLKAYLKGLLTSDINWSSWYNRDSKNSTKALILTVLSELGEKNLNSSIAKLFSEREGLNLFGLSFLTGFMSQDKNYQNEAKTLIAKLESLKISESGQTWFKEPYESKDELYKFWNHTDLRSVCATLQNITKYSSDKSMSSEVVKHILREMGGDGQWYNTQESIYCFEALRRYVAKFETADTKASMDIKVDSRDIKNSPVIKKGVSTVVLDSKELRTETKNVSMKSSKGELYYSSILRYETPFKNREKINQGFGLTKSFYKLESAGNKVNWLLMKDEIIRLKRGDVLKVVLEVETPSDRYQVMLNDNLAGCLEPINTQLATTSLINEAILSSRKTYEWESPYYKGNGFEYLDLRLDAAQFYSRKLNKGTFTVEYMVQTIATGEFLMPESTVEEMYYPDVRGTEKGRKFIVTE